MKDLIINERSWLIKTDERIAVQHTPDQPFATVLKREKTYVTDRGSVKETISVTETSPLTEFEEKQKILDTYSEKPNKEVENGKHKQ